MNGKVYQLSLDQTLEVISDLDFGELERQIMLSTGCPGIVLYGRRRTGKSTVLLNLSGFLPATVLPACPSLPPPSLRTR